MEAQKNDPEKSIGTLDVLHYLQEQTPDASFHLALGGDTYLDLIHGKWKNGMDILALVPIEVIHREGIDLKEYETKLGEKLHRIPQLKPVSSTLARTLDNDESLSEFLHRDTIDYIKEHQLYAFETHSK